MGSRAAERVAHATQTGDDWRVAGALGMEAARGREDVALVLRARAVDPDAVVALVGRLTAVARGMAHRHRWRTRRGQLAAVASAVITYWLAPACTRCRGRGTAPGARRPQKVCQACGGTGDSGIVLPPALHDDHWRRYATDLLEWLRERERRAERAVDHQLHG